MSFATQQVQGHYLGLAPDQSTVLHFKQHIGDLNLAANIAYVLVAIVVILCVTSVALTYGMNEPSAVLVATLLSVAAVALRIKIFNRYAFAMGRIRVSPQGDLEWPNGWLEHAAVGRIDVMQSGASGRYQVVCISVSGETHTLGSGLPEARAKAIRRDIEFALHGSTSGTTMHSGNDL